MRRILRIIRSANPTNPCSLQSDGILRADARAQPAADATLGVNPGHSVRFDRGLFEADPRAQAAVGAFLRVNRGVGVVAHLCFGHSAVGETAQTVDVGHALTGEVLAQLFLDAVKDLQPAQQRRGDHTHRRPAGSN